ncbi:MAG TPA: AAA family ATPase [Smithellaceae bacterium]|nr:AAA family ATPase [Smithellaceae bacterium]HRS89330.1 AAA family ATPase [Smithellaceae bacterium]HRV25200.1 AAA family ATPase [Smithellaceae bacterium]
MKIFIITGMPAAGKNIAVQYAHAHKYPLFSTGDFVRAEIRKRGVSGDPEMSAKISTEMRGHDGLGVTRLAVAEALKANAKVVFLEGIRSWPEVEWIRSQTDCQVVAVVAPRAIRLNRVRQRGREDDSVEHFALRDQREIEYGVAVCIALADAYVLNIGTMEDALSQLDSIVKKGS